MKHILGNPGNRKWFGICQRENRRIHYKGLLENPLGFSVNVWIMNGKPSYDAGFYVGSDKCRKPASFTGEFYRRNVGYRIRVKPKWNAK